MSNAALKKSDIYMDEDFQETEPVSEDGRNVSEQEYWENYYEHPDFNYEWNNGILEEVPVSDYENFAMCKWLMKIMDHYIEKHGAGKLVIHEFGFRLALTEKVTIRKPDLAVVLTENLVDLDDDDRSFKGSYDLCVECLSDLTSKGIKRDTVYKKNEYEEIGVKEYFVIDSDYHMTFYRLNKRGSYEHIIPVRGNIIQSEVLKGFQFRISDLYKQPPLEQLADNELYSDFVFPAYKKIKERAEKAEKQAEAERLKAERENKKVEKEKKRADKEKNRADKEKQRAEAAQRKAEEERLRAERLAERLRSMGISID